MDDLISTEDVTRVILRCSQRLRQHHDDAHYFQSKKLELNYRTGPLPCMIHSFLSFLFFTCTHSDVFFRVRVRMSEI